MLVHASWYTPQPAWDGQVLAQPSLLKVLAQVNSVQFSNHTGYPTMRGQKLDGPGLWELVEGLQSNGLLSYTHLLTGIFQHMQVCMPSACHPPWTNKQFYCSLVRAKLGVQKGG